MSAKQNFYAHGKLLLSGEYFVLDGALALALPTRQGQQLTLAPDRSVAEQFLHWKSLGPDGDTWLEAELHVETLRLRHSTDAGMGERLEQIIQAIDVLTGHRNFWLPMGGQTITTQLEFPRQWGLGSSSTLISCLAQLSSLNAHQLLAHTFGGSGYDLACATARGPLLYQIGENGPGHVEVPFQPAFTDRLYFVYLEEKQNSRDGIAHYRQLPAGRREEGVRRINELTYALLSAETCEVFEALLLEHEEQVAAYLQLPRAAQRFMGFPGLIKSLGAWGGDFVLAVSPWAEAETRAYFSEAGYPLCIPYREMIL